ncbi:MAG TPA: Mut7-C RNAse domain-containing protein, partial [Nitrospirota bacterium]|nr:Mut7-C RNAse domain-containing protein [Nitrospirota bacterium]
IVSIPKNEVRDLVPHYVYEKNTVFFQCPKCKRIYWPGTHVKKMERHNIKITGSLPRDRS